MLPYEIICEIYKNTPIHILCACYMGMKANNLTSTCLYEYLSRLRYIPISADRFMKLYKMLIYNDINLNFYIRGLSADLQSIASSIFIKQNYQTDVFFGNIQTIIYYDNNCFEILTQNLSWQYTFENEFVIVLSSNSQIFVYDRILELGIKIYRSYFHNAYFVDVGLSDNIYTPNTYSFVLDNSKDYHANVNIIPQENKMLDYIQVEYDSGGYVKKLIYKNKTIYDNKSLQGIFTL